MTWTQCNSNPILIAKSTMRAKFGLVLDARHLNAFIANVNITHYLTKDNLRKLKINGLFDKCLFKVAKKLANFSFKFRFPGRLKVASFD